MGKARTGAAKKDLREAISLTVNPETVARLDALTVLLDLPRGRIVDRAVRELEARIKGDDT